MPSMGPRLLGRGNVAAGKRHCAGEHAFNGAASVGTRKSIYLDSLDMVEESFNGAASVGTRKSGTIHNALADCGDLQWGRVCWDAEMVLAAREPGRP